MTKTPKPAEPVPVQPTPPSLRGWFAQTKHRPGLVLPLAVLALIDELCSVNGVCTVADLNHEVHSGVATDAIHTLKALGYIRTDGITITIQQRPA